MLRYFFEKPINKFAHPELVEGSNRNLFEGLEITQYPEIMERQGKIPVISLSLKGMEGARWKDVFAKIQMIIACRV